MSGPTSVLAHGLDVAAGELTVLNGVELRLAGGIVAVLGRNGAGKTSLLRCLATVTPPAAGDLLVDGLDPRFPSDRTEIRRRLGYLPQRHGLGGRNRVLEVLDYVAALRRLGDDDARRRAALAALDEVGLVDRAGERLDRLSGGQVQRVGVAAALMGEPSLLVLDEPFAALDPDERLRLRSALSRRRRQATVVVSTHVAADAADADLVLVVGGGGIRFCGAPARLAALAEGRVWLRPDRPGPSEPGLRAWWEQADGWVRCVGDPPAGVTTPASPTVEEGYLVLTPGPDGAPHAD